MFGWTAEEVVGRHFGDWQFVHPDDAARVAEISARLVDGRDQRNVSHNRNLTKSGKVVHSVWQNSVLHDRRWAHRFDAFAGAGRDGARAGGGGGAGGGSGRRALERKLQEAQKLESLGVLAGGIAHDFNNLLTGILGNASLARDDLGPSSPVQPFLEQIERAAHARGRFVPADAGLLGQGAL